MKRGTIILILVLVSSLASYSQFSAGVEGIYILPIGGFSGWFDRHYSGTVYIGQANQENSFVAGRIEYYKFYRENTDKLYYKDLSLELKIYGLGAEYRHSVYRVYFLNFYGVIGAGLYRWFGLRGEYYFKDSSGNVIDYVAERRYQDWSGGFWGGGGMELKSLEIYL